MFHVPCILKGSAMWKVSCTKKKNVELGDQTCQKVLKKKQRFRRRLSQTHVIMWYFCRLVILADKVMQ